MKSQNSVSFRSLQCTCTRESFRMRLRECVCVCLFVCICVSIGRNTTSLLHKCRTGCWLNTQNWFGGNWDFDKDCERCLLWLLNDFHETNSENSPQRLQKSHKPGGNYCCWTRWYRVSYGRRETNDRHPSIWRTHATSRIARRVTVSRKIEPQHKSLIGWPPTSPIIFDFLHLEVPPDLAPLRGQ